MKPISVLLVDDNPTFLRIAAQFLEANDDISVIGTADGGERALERAQALHPHIILIDLAMPGMTGLQAIPRLRNLLPDVRIIALTVMDTQSFRQAALTAGADIFIPKAMMRSELLPAVRKLAQAQLAAAEPEPLKPATRSETRSVRRVLVMEDDDSLRRLYGKALAAVGYEVHPAGTIDEARDLLNQIHFDILLCDIQMGSDRGTDLLREFSDTLFTSGAQVIMVSGQAQYRPICEEMGADFFLEKPVAINTLVALIDRISGRPARQPVPG